MLFLAIIFIVGYIFPMTSSVIGSAATIPVMCRKGQGENTPTGMRPPFPRSSGGLSLPPPFIVKSCNDLKAAAVIQSIKCPSPTQRMVIKDMQWPSI